jgi:hypothetical protein
MKDKEFVRKLLLDSEEKTSSMGQSVTANANVWQT